MPKIVKGVARAEVKKTRVIKSLQHEADRLDKLIVRHGNLPIGGPADDKASAPVVRANEFPGVDTDVVDEIALGLESIVHLTMRATDECGTSGQYLHYAISNLAGSLAKQAQISVESATQSRGGDTDAVENIGFGLRSIAHLSTVADAECGTSGHRLRFAIRKLAENLSELARVSVEAAALNGGAK